ncbi:MAG TPA: hypothetical protein PKH97_00045 [Tetrasphaera sp.]|uniref:hypothetical protein n=1 Tax=Nostocoides sp. TaxID=1917966 RepID=UPI002CB27CB5|nr:hypothetical protein [Tetrasphaera sp.]HNQ05562.1 hypothetical protein [Tetrasphaera sp.]
MARRAWILAPATALALAGCGNVVTTKIVGMAGLTADAAGNPVVIVAPCGAAYDQVQVVGMIDRRTADATEDNPILLEMSSGTMHSDPFTVSLTRPGPGWSSRGTYEPEDQIGIYVGVGSSTKDMGSTPVQISAADYEQVRADVVIVREGERWSRADFDRIACDHNAWPTVASSTS